MLIRCRHILTSLAASLIEVIIDDVTAKKFHTSTGPPPGIGPSFSTGRYTDRY